MNDLLKEVLDAHGGLERWNRFTTLNATIVTGGELWAMKGAVQDTMPREMTVSLHQQSASVKPFGNPHWCTAFRADYITIETTDGEIVRERSSPRESFAGHDMNTPWDPLHRAYFSGYAMWTYLTTPFFMAMPGSTSLKYHLGRKAPRPGAVCGSSLRTISPATAVSRIFTSWTMACCGDMTITSMWPVGLQPPST